MVVHHASGAAAHGGISPDPPLTGRRLVAEARPGLSRSRAAACPPGPAGRWPATAALALDPINPGQIRLTVTAIADPSPSRNDRRLTGIANRLPPRPRPVKPRLTMLMWQSGHMRHGAG